MTNNTQLRILLITMAFSACLLHPTAAREYCQKYWDGPRGRISRPARQWVQPARRRQNRVMERLAGQSAAPSGLDSSATPTGSASSNSQHPTQIPSQQPSQQPTQQPFQDWQEPSNDSSNSQHPTQIPSQQPSQQPTQQPFQDWQEPSNDSSNSQHPTQIPSQQPSQQPTQQPFQDWQEPSNDSQIPSQQPPQQPTQQPSQQPSNASSNSPLGTAVADLEKAEKAYPAMVGLLKRSFLEREGEGSNQNLTNEDYKKLENCPTTCPDLLEAAMALLKVIEGMGDKYESADAKLLNKVKRLSYLLE